MGGGDSCVYCGEGNTKFPSGKLPISLSTGGKEYEVVEEEAPPPATYTPSESSISPDIQKGSFGIEKGHTPSLGPNAHPAKQYCRDVPLYGCRRNPDHGSALHFLPAPGSGGLLGQALPWHCKHTCSLTCYDTCHWGRGVPPQPRN